MITDLVNEEVNMELVFKQIESSISTKTPIREEFIKEEVSDGKVGMSLEALIQARSFLLSSRVFSNIAQTMESNHKQIGVKAYSLVKINNE